MRKQQFSKLIRRLLRGTTTGKIRWEKTKEPNAYVTPLAGQHGDVQNLVDIDLFETVDGDEVLMLRLLDSEGNEISRITDNDFLSGPEFRGIATMMAELHEAAGDDARGVRPALETALEILKDFSAADEPDPDDIPF